MQVSLRAARTNANLTLRQSAEKLGTNKIYLSDVENGKAFPSTREKERMSELYKMPLKHIRFPEDELRSKS